MDRKEKIFSDYSPRASESKGSSKIVTQSKLFTKIRKTHKNWKQTRTTDFPGNQEVDVDRKDHKKEESLCG